MHISQIDPDVICKPVPTISGSFEKSKEHLLIPSTLLFAACFKTGMSEGCYLHCASPSVDE